MLTIPEFFDGNESEGSIGCNLVPTPSPAEFRVVLERIAGREDVVDVRVQITMFDEPDYWPFSDTVWIVTRASPDEVRGWFSSEMAPDESWKGWQADRQYEPCEVPDGFAAVACWWD